MEKQSSFYKLIKKSFDAKSYYLNPLQSLIKQRYILSLKMTENNISKLSSSKRIEVEKENSITYFIAMKIQDVFNSSFCYGDIGVNKDQLNKCISMMKNEVKRLNDFNNRFLSSKNYVCKLNKKQVKEILRSYFTDEELQEDLFADLFFFYDDNLNSSYSLTHKKDS